MKYDYEIINDELRDYRFYKEDMLRNLPDKEFRYLRTVIVTAAVYRGSNSMLPIAGDISS